MIVSSVCRTRCVNRPGRSKRRRCPVPFEGFGSNPKDHRSALEIYCASYIRLGETKENEESGTLNPDPQRDGTETHLSIRPMFVIATRAIQPLEGWEGGLA